MKDRILGLPIWLIASLAVNAVLVGAVAGLFAANVNSNHRPEPDKRERRGGPEEIERTIGGHLMRSSNESVRKGIRRRFSEEWRQSKPMREEITRKREALRGAIAAEPYDPDQVVKQFAELRDAENAMKERFHLVLADMIGDLPVETRQILLNRERHGDRDRGRPPPRERDGLPPPPLDDDGRPIPTPDLSED